VALNDRETIIKVDPVNWQQISRLAGRNEFLSRHEGRPDLDSRRIGHVESGISGNRSKAESTLL
jgi:hypothetical protein